MKSHTHIEFWHVDGTILYESDENAAPFKLKIGEQIMFGNNSYQVKEVIDTGPTDVKGTLHYRRVIRLE